MLLLQASLSSVAVIGCNEQSMERAYIPTRPRAKGNKKGSLLLSIISNSNSNSNSLHRFPLRLYTPSVSDSASSPLQQHSLHLLLSLLLHHQEQKQQRKPRNKK
jgi:hypothetical protein